MPKKNPEDHSDRTQQYKLKIQRQLIDRLTRLGRDCGYASGNAFAADALDQYAELLAELIREQNAAHEALRRRQVEEVVQKVKGGTR